MKKSSGIGRKKQFLYRELAGKIRSEIETGVLRPGDRLPSMDNLVEKSGISKITVCRAIKELVVEGWVYSEPTRGVFVADARPVAGNGASANGQPPSVGLIARTMVPGNIGYYHLMLQEAIRSALGRRGANLVVLPAHSINPEHKIVEWVVRSALSAAIYIDHFEAATIKKLVAFGPVAVLVEHVVPGAKLDVFTQNNAEGAFQAVSHLLELGHRRLALVEGLPNHHSTRERRAGALEAISQAGLSTNDILFIQGDYTRSSGKTAMLEILEQATPPSGAFFMNDEMALGAMEAAREKGVDIPGDISIVGYDDIPLAGEPQVSLSTVHSPVAEIGAMAANAVLDRLQGNDSPRQNVSLTPSMMVRKTSSPPREGKSNPTT